MIKLYSKINCGLGPNVGADIFVGITIYRSHKKVVSAGPWKHAKPPHNVLAPESTLTRVNSHPGQLSLAPVSTSGGFWLPVFPILIFF